MCGVKRADRLLQLRCGDGKLLTALAANVGLTGRACAFDRDAAKGSQARTVAEKAGVLVEVDSGSYGNLAYDNASFDVVVLNDLLGGLSPADRVACLREVLRVLRPGGRCLVIEPAPRGGLGALFNPRSLDRHHAASGGAERALAAEGFRAVRRLAERNGQLFTDGGKPGGSDQTPQT